MITVPFSTAYRFQDPRFIGRGGAFETADGAISIPFTELPTANVIYLNPQTLEDIRRWGEGEPDAQVVSDLLRGGGIRHIGVGGD